MGGNGDLSMCLLRLMKMLDVRIAIRVIQPALSKWGAEYTAIDTCAIVAAVAGEELLAFVLW